MIKIWQIIIFVTIMLLYLWFPFNMIRQTKKVLKKGIPHHFLLQPIDPYDVFRGRYVILNYANDLLPVQDSMYESQEVFVEVIEDSLGFSRFGNVFTTRPDGSDDYIRTTVDYYTNGKIQVAIPENIRYYYVNEQKAPEIEKIMMRPNNDSVSYRAHAIIRIYKGEPAVEELYINDIPVNEFIKK